MAKKKATKAKAKARPRAKAKSRSKSSSGNAQYNAALDGVITHTEFASTDPDATKTWLSKALGWKFRPSMPMGDGSTYHLFMYSNQGGGGIRVNSPQETPGTVPYVQVANVKKAFDKAIKAGANVMMPPSPVMEGLHIAIVLAPGGVAVGFAGPK
ncbi:MAG TPA: VOC family protein [Candidatus Krumholzibacteria bacterium]|nr:VOC family protein [Candidatus Krumholzibacteria bacterium]